MTVERLVEILAEFPQDMTVNLEVAELRLEVDEVYEDPAFGVVFICSEEE